MRSHDSFTLDKQKSNFFVGNYMPRPGNALTMTRRTSGKRAYEFLPNTPVVEKSMTIIHLASSTMKNYSGICQIHQSWEHDIWVYILFIIHVSTPSILQTVEQLMVKLVNNKNSKIC